VELLDPSLVDGRGGLRGEAYRSHVVRRLKRHIKDPTTGEERGAIDTVVADAYGLTREQYAHVLASFSHRSYPKGAGGVPGRLR
jgi:hypothetical protein